MPQASDVDRERMRRWFGDSVSEVGPMRLLALRGYELTGDWCWRPPGIYYTISVEEARCIQFLIDEWDFGGLAPEWRGCIQEQHI